MRVQGASCSWNTKCTASQAGCMSIAVIRVGNEKVVERARRASADNELKTIVEDTP